EKRFLPMGSDKDVSSNFQLLAGTNQDLAHAVAAGRFREDLYARLNLWAFQLPGLRDRREDIEPNLDYELRRYSDQEGRHVTFNKEARAAYLAYAHQASAVWAANFRDLSASVTRMATFSPQGRIDEETVHNEISRLQAQWNAIDSLDSNSDAILAQVLTPDAIAQIDLFDRAQLAQVIQTCQQSESVSEAGRALFASSRQQKKTGNDADRLRKYLLKFDLRFDQISAL
ncbi:MAG: sigma 54-interacting transcriptional regulator, partial [Pseudomonadota bacterium]